MNKYTWWHWYLKLSGIAVSRHVVADFEQAIHCAVRAVVTLPLLLNVRLKYDVGLETHTHTHTHTMTHGQTHIIENKKTTFRMCLQKYNVFPSKNRI